MIYSHNLIPFFLFYRRFVCRFFFSFSLLFIGSKHSQMALELDPEHRYTYTRCVHVQLLNWFLLLCSLCLQRIPWNWDIFFCSYLLLLLLLLRSQLGIIWRYRHFAQNAMAQEISIQQTAEKQFHVLYSKLLWVMVEKKKTFVPETMDKLLSNK